LGIIDKDETEGGARAKLANVSTQPNDPEPYGPEVYTRSKAKPMRLSPCFYRFGARGRPKFWTVTQAAEEMWPFFRGLFALLDRGRVWIVGRETASKIKVLRSRVNPIQNSPDFN